MVEEQLALEHVQRLLVRVDVALEPAARMQRADRELGVDRALLRPDEDLPGETVRAVGRRHRTVGEGPVDVSDVIHGWALR